MILNTDALEGLKTLADKSVHTCITSPPYYRLRDYGIEGQIGLEETPEEYIEKLVEVFGEVRRVLRDDGTLWVNIGDTYSQSGRGHQGKQYISKSWDPAFPGVSCNLPKKNLIGIPWMLAFALRQDGWYLRQDIIWSKPNPMPESVNDRCTKSHEYIFLLSKSSTYYFDSDAIAEPTAESTLLRLGQDLEQQKGSARIPDKSNGEMKAKAPRYKGKKYTANPDLFYRTKSATAYDDRPLRNKRSVWTVCTEKHSEAHFAIYPKELIRPCVLAGAPVDGSVLDPFCGSGTTGEVAHEEGRDFIGIEINPKYALMSEQRSGHKQNKLFV